MYPLDDVTPLIRDAITLAASEAGERPITPLPPLPPGTARLGRASRMYFYLTFVWQQRLIRGGPIDYEPRFAVVPYQDGEEMPFGTYFDDLCDALKIQSRWQCSRKARRLGIEARLLYTRSGFPVNLAREIKRMLRDERRKER